MLCRLWPPIKRSTACCATASRWNSTTRKRRTEQERSGCWILTILQTNAIWPSPSSGSRASAVSAARCAALRQRHAAGLHRAEKLQREAAKRLRRQPDELTRRRFRSFFPIQRLLRARPMPSKPRWAASRRSGSISSTGCARMTRRRRSTAHAIAKEGISLEGVIDGFFPRRRCWTMWRISFSTTRTVSKIIAQNHQFIGVNRRIRILQRREELEGKLGVFWHTQGSGKSFSMIFLCAQNFPQTDRQFHLCGGDRPRRSGRADLPQLPGHRHGQQSRGRPAQEQRGDARIFSGSNKRLVFTLIQKFRWDKGKEYPRLSTEQRHHRDRGRGAPHAIQVPGGEHAQGVAQRAVSGLYRHAAAGHESARPMPGLGIMSANTISCSPWTTARRCRCFTRNAFRRF